MSPQIVVIVDVERGRLAGHRIRLHVPVVEGLRRLVDAALLCRQGVRPAVVHQQQVVDAAMSEDADFIGMSILSGAHMTLFTEVTNLLKANDATDIVVFGGGIIPEADIPALEALGVARIFTPGTPTQDVVDWVNDRARASDVSPTR